MPKCRFIANAGVDIALNAACGRLIPVRNNDAVVVEGGIVIREWFPAPERVFTPAASRDYHKYMMVP